MYITSPPTLKKRGAYDDYEENNPSGNKRLKTSPSDHSPVTPTIETPPEKANAPAYDAFFVDNNDELSTLAGQLTTQQPSQSLNAGQEQRLAVIQCPEDLDQGNLIRELKISGGVPQSGDGLVFSDTPVTLLIDFRQFPSGRIAELNELFENPPRLKGRELGSNVRIVSIISQAMLPGSGQPDLPGPDFWWRINSTCPPRQASSIMAGQSVNKHCLQAWLDRNVADLDSPEPKNSPEPMDTGVTETVIDFTGHPWRSLLFGSPDVNEEGQLIHRPGALEGLTDGQKLIFKNAPWQNQAFVVELARTLQSKCFRSNGSNVALPEQLTLFRQSLSTDEMQTLAQSIQWQTGTDSNHPVIENPALINQDNFASLMHENVLTKEGKICRRDMLAQWLDGCDGIRITSPLTEDQWLQLVSRLQKANRLSCPVCTDVPEQQPPLFRGSASGTGPAAKPMTFATHGRATVRIEHCDGNSQLPLSASNPMEEFVILPEQSLTKIAQQTEIVSLQQRQFKCSLNRLITCLKEGTPVCLSGLQSNPVLLRQLETLLCSPPHLVLYGQRETFPNMQLTITWPKNREIPSPVWQAFALSDTGNASGQQIDETMETESWALPAFSKLYSTLDHLKVATYCPSDPPGDLQQLFQKVLDQARSEQEMDGCEELLPCHFHQAVSSVVLKEYRASQEVYSYLKHLSARLFLTETSGWIDREYLQEWLARHPLPDRSAVRKEFWSLARAFPATMFENQQVPDKKDEDKLLAILILLASPDNSKLRQQARDFAKLSDRDLTAASETLAELHNRSRQREKTFYKRLACLDRADRQSGSLREQAWTLACAELQGETALQEAAGNLLTETARTQTGLWQMLCAREHDWQSWEQHRVRRLAEKVRRNPVVCIKGETGAGKSYIAEAVARSLNSGQSPQVITVGPETELSDLLGKLVLKPGDAAMETSQGEGQGEENEADLHTERLPAPLSQWVQTPAQDNKPVVLIIDEANLAIPELWNCLKGLYETPPCLHIHGDRLPVSPSHRIIMTGNPDHFSGRRMNELLRIRAPQLYYKPLTPAFIQEKVLRPGLTEVLAQFMANQEIDKEILQPCVDQMISSIGLLYQQYQLLLPKRTFTPRDLTDLISRIQATLMATPMERSAEHGTTAFTVEGLNGLVWQAFEDALGGEVSEQKQAEKTALKVWFGNKQPFDNSLTNAQQKAFEQFYSQWLLDRGKQQSPGIRFDYSNDSVRILMRRIWLEQQRSSYEKITGTLHRGRHATVISGPAGRGKSALLDQQLTLMCQQAGQPLPKQINAGHSAWELLQQEVCKAKQQGYPLIISELNLLKSEEIEGLLNNAITGQAAPGFHLYTTVNPDSFVGRHRFSPALKNRFTCLSISEYTDQDIRIIASAVLPNNLGLHLREQLIDWHLRLRYFLQQNQIPLQPAVADLQRLRQILEKEFPLESPSQAQLEEIFTGQYSLFLKAGKCTLATLPPLANKANDTDADSQMDRLVQALNNASLTQPIVVTRNPEVKSIQAQSVNRVTVPATLTETTDLNEARQQAQLAIALRDWEQQSGSTQPSSDHDTLYSACYRLWQRDFIKTRHSLPPDLLPLTREQQAALEHPDNQQLLERVRELFSQPPSPRALELTWTRLNTPVSREEQKPSEPKVTKDLVSPVQPIARPPIQTFATDGRTKKQDRCFKVKQVFKDTPPREQRMQVLQLNVNQGSVCTTTLPLNEYGCDVIYPEPLQSPVFTLGEEQYGVVSKKLSCDQFTVLPGLYAHQVITRLTTVPDIDPEQLEVIRDRGTGQLLIRLKTAQSHISGEVELHYVVKRQQTDTRHEEKLPDSPDTPLNRLIPEEVKRKFLRFNNPELLMEGLAKWGRSFKADKDISAGDDSGILTEIIRQQQGACRHRVWAVYAIAAARGVPVRLVKSDTHEWIEYSADRGHTWKKVETPLGGSGANTAQPEKPAFKESAKGIRLAPDRRDALLAQARANPEQFAEKMGASIGAVNEWIASNGDAPLKLDHGICCFNQLFYSEPGDLRAAVEMIKSGAINASHFESSFTALKFAKRFSKALLECTSQTERESILELLYELKAFFNTWGGQKGAKNWLLFILKTSFKISKSDKATANNTLLDFWNYSILKKSLLNDFALKDFSWMPIDILRHLGSLGTQKTNTAMAEIASHLNKYFEPYYSMIKAPAVKRLQAASGRKTAITTKGSSPSLEQRLKTTSIGTGFTWLPEGEITIDRLLKQLAPFREQKARVSTRKVRLILNSDEELEPSSIKYEIRLELLKRTNLTASINNQIESLLTGKNPYKSHDIIDELESFFDRPTPEFRDFLLENDVTLTPELSGALSQYLEIDKKAENIASELLQSFVVYLAEKTEASRGNLGMYSLAEDETQRGYQLLTSKEAILEADSMTDEFLPLPEPLIKKHLQEEDSESLFMFWGEIETLIEEYAQNIIP